jgi:hypothetical protein
MVTVLSAVDVMVSQLPSREDPKWLRARAQLAVGLQHVVDEELARPERLARLNNM